MKVLQIPRRFVREPWGGTETVVLETSKRLRSWGHEIEIFCSNALADTDRETIDGIPVRRMSYSYPYLGLDRGARQQLDGKGGNAFSFELLRALRREPDVDLLHLHTGKRLGGIARHVARQRNIPYVVTLHGGVHDVPPEEAATWTAPTEGTFEWGRALGWWVGSRRVLHDAAAILCVGAEERRQTAQHFPEKRVLHLPNGVDQDRFAHGNNLRFRTRYGVPADARVVLVTGRVDPQKNQHYAVSLLPHLRQLDPNIHLLIVGPTTDPAYGDRLNDTIRRNGLTKHVTVTGGFAAKSQDLVDAYHASDVLFVPSIHEPFGIVVLEAWAAGLPVVANRVGGIPSFLAHDENGVLVDPGNDQEAIAALHGLLNDPGRAIRVARSGRVTAIKDYSWDRVTERLLSIYEEVLRCKS